MFENSILLLDWLGIVVFTITGALVASRKQMDAIGFILLGTVTGIVGGTIRDLILDAHPVFWLDRPQYLAVCVVVSAAAFFTAFVRRLVKNFSTCFTSALMFCFITAHVAYISGMISLITNTTRGTPAASEQPLALL